MSQARRLEWVPILFSREASLLRDQTQVSCIAGRSFTIWAIRGNNGIWGRGCYRCSLSWLGQLCHGLNCIPWKTCPSPSPQYLWLWPYLEIESDVIKTRIKKDHPGLGMVLNGFPGGSDGKASACSMGDPGSIPGSGRSPGEGNGNPLQYSCLENSMDGGALWTTVHGVTKSRTGLSDFTSLHLNPISMSSEEDGKEDLMHRRGHGKTEAETGGMQPRTKKHPELEEEGRILSGALRESSCLCACSHMLSCFQLFATSWTAAHQAFLSFTILSPGACSNSCPLSQWCHPTIISSVALFSSWLQSFPASGLFIS